MEFTKGKKAIELVSEAEVADTLRKVRKVRKGAELGELDALVKQQAQFGKRLVQKNKWTRSNEKTEEYIWIKLVLRLALRNY